MRHLAQHPSPTRVVNNLNYEVGMDNDGIYIDYLRFLIDVGQGALTISFQSFKNSFGDVDEDGMDDAVYDALEVLELPDVLSKLSKLEDAGPYIISKLGGSTGKWAIHPTNRIPKLSPLDPPVIAADEILPRYPHFRTVRMQELLIEQGLDVSDTAEVSLKDDQRRYFFKAVTRKSKEGTLREIAVLADLDHPSVVALHALVLNCTGDVVGLLFPFASRGDLTQPVNLEASLAVKVRWVKDIVSALQYVVSRNHHYEDIKASNIVVFDDVQAKLIDFDGGWTEGHFSPKYDCFGLGVLLENLGCRGPGLDELIAAAKATRMDFTVFLARLEQLPQFSC